ncbi:hypothetical protein EON64_06535 [archaeon]|nr:MAG: hypothetical protein EON64_06535 [archaeon]
MARCEVSLTAFANTDGDERYSGKAVSEGIQAASTAAQELGSEDSQGHEDCPHARLGGVGRVGGEV